jgi:hypothetical protein
VLTPPLPLRAFGLAALLAVVGAAVIVTASAARLSPVLSVIGWIALAGAVALCVVAWTTWRRMRVRVELTDEGYTIDGPDAHEQGDWSDVTKLTQSPTTLVIHHGDEHRVRLVSQRGVTAELIHLTGDLVRRLDASRGYTSQL